MADPRFYRNTGPYTLAALRETLQALGCAVTIAKEDEALTVDDVNTLQDAVKGQISFLDNPKYAPYLATSQASACILHPKYAEKAPKGMALLVTEFPYAAYAFVTTHFYPEAVKPSPPSFTGKYKAAATATIMPGAIIADGAEIGAGSVIYPGAYVGDGVVIGEGCTLFPHCTVLNSIIGNHVMLHAGVCLGQDGFGFATFKGRHYTVPQLGRVILHDHVNIGANSIVDRGTLGDTVIGEGTRLDNAVHVAHNVTIGKGCIFAAQVGISGSTQIGEYVVMGGQVGIAGHLTVGSGARIAAQSGVLRDIKAGEAIGGSPAVPLTQHHRQQITLQQLVKKKS